MTQVIQERHQQETFNRFKALKETYSQLFDYSHRQREFKISCQVTYLPYESLIDRISFEYFVIKTMP